MGLKRAVCLLGLVAAALLPGMARADTAPHLVSAYPYDGAILRSSTVQDFTATYDRDLMGPPLSSVVILDGQGIAVRGDTALSGPTSPTGGKRSITFKPANPFREAAGEYHVDVNVMDTGGSGTSRNEFRFKIDDTAPLVPTITKPLENAHHKTTFRIEGTTSPFAFVRVSALSASIPDVFSNDKGLWETQATMSEGIHGIYATATDGAGNESAPSSTVTVTVDGTAPGPPVIEFPIAGTVLRSSNFAVGGTAEAGSTITVLTGTTPRATTSADHTGRWQASVTLEDGPYGLSATATDLAGNTGARAPDVAITVDATLGAPKVTTPAQGVTIASRTVQFIGTSAAGWTVRLSENGVLLGSAPVAADNSWTATLTLPEGVRTIDVQAFLGSDATGTTRRTFTIDTTGPAPPMFTSPVPGGVIRATSAPIQGKTEPGAVVRVFEGDVLRGQSLAFASGSWGFEITLANGPHTFRAYAIDRAGNVGQWATVTFHADGTIPVAVIGTPDLSASVTDSFRIEGTARDDDSVARVQVAYRDAVRGLVLTENAIMSPVGGPLVDWYAHGSGLRPGLYTVQVIAFDRAGNPSIAQYVRMIRIQ